jgi:hypothetical protein
MSCDANLTYSIGEGGAWSDCRHTNGYHYCVVGENGHDGKHKAPVTFAASTNAEPFLYELIAVVEWD